jgi:hypothetical protein
MDDFPEIDDVLALLSDVNPEIKGQVINIVKDLCLQLAEAEDRIYELQEESE